MTTNFLELQTPTSLGRSTYRPNGIRLPLYALRIQKAKTISFNMSSPPYVAAVNTAFCLMMTCSRHLRHTHLKTFQNYPISRCAVKLIFGTPLRLSWRSRQGYRTSDARSSGMIHTTFLEHSRPCDRKSILRISIVKNKQLQFSCDEDKNNRLSAGVLAKYKPRLARGVGSGFAIPSSATCRMQYRH
jgi:hypothetical protein